jgi:hypothetical protein
MISATCSAVIDEGAATVETDMGLLRCLMPDFRHLLRAN